MKKHIKVEKVRNGYYVTLVEITGLLETETQTKYVFRSWSEVMVCVSEFFGEYEGD